MTTYARPRFGPMVDPDRLQTEKELEDVNKEMLKERTPYKSRQTQREIEDDLRRALDASDFDAFDRLAIEMEDYGMHISQLPPDLQIHFNSPEMREEPRNVMRDNAADPEPKDY